MLGFMEFLIIAGGGAYVVGVSISFSHLLFSSSFLLLMATFPFSGLKGLPRLARSAGYAFGATTQYARFAAVTTVV